MFAVSSLFSGSRRHLWLLAYTSGTSLLVQSSQGLCLKHIYYAFSRNNNFSFFLIVERVQIDWLVKVLNLLKVGMVAINDAIVLRSQISRILKNHFSDKSYYIHLLDLFNEVNFTTWIFNSFSINKSLIKIRTIGWVPDCLGTNVRLNLIHWRRARSLQIHTVAVSKH